MNKRNVDNIFVKSEIIYGHENEAYNNMKSV